MYKGQYLRIACENHYIGQIAWEVFSLRRVAFEISLSTKEVSSNRFKKIDSNCSINSVRHNYTIHIL